MASLVCFAAAVLVVLVTMSTVDGMGYNGQTQGGAGYNMDSYRQARAGPGGPGGPGGNYAGQQQQQYSGRSELGQPQGYDAQQYNFRIYMEPEYTGYEAKYPGGRAMYKSYRSVPDYGYAGRDAIAVDAYGAGMGRSGKAYDASSSFRPQRGSDFGARPMH